MSAPALAAVLRELEVSAAAWEALLEHAAHEAGEELWPHDHARRN